MLDVKYEPDFLKKICKIKDNSLKDHIKKQIIKITQNPEVGKPMRFDRKETRELRVPPFRLNYIYDKAREILIFLDVYHKDEQ
jgi:mRNA-degrading endonuclease RelE of RelBE toxin-antitoxin system